MFSIKTAAAHIDDWHHIELVSGRLKLRRKNEAVASKRSRSNTMAIAVSHQHNVVALASDSDGEPILEVKQQCFYPLPLVLRAKTLVCSCRLVKPLSLTFSEGGTRLLLLTGNVSPFTKHI